MSNADANKNLATFGLLCLILALLSLVAVFVRIIGSFVLFLLVFVIYFIMVLQIGIYVLIIIAAVMVGKVGSGLNNDNLLTFRTYIIIGSVLKLAGSVLLTFIGPIGINAIVARATSPGSGTPEAIAVYVTWGIILLSFLIMIIVGGVLNIIAWGRLKRFFDANMAMFSEEIGKSAKTGAFICQIGEIFFLTFFLVIIGFISNVIGYFMLSKLKNVK